MRPNIEKLNNRNVPKASAIGTILYQDSVDERLYYKDRNGNVVGIAISADVTGNNELSEILTNSNITGGTNIEITSGDNITWNGTNLTLAAAANALTLLDGTAIEGWTLNPDVRTIISISPGANGTLDFSGLTGNRVFTFPDGPGTIALLSDVQAADALNEVLANGNTSGANNIVMTAGQQIASSSGASALDLRVDALDNTFALSSDNATYAESWFYGTSSIAQWGFGGTYLASADSTSITMSGSSTGAGILHTNIAGLASTIGASVAAIKVVDVTAAGTGALTTAANTAVAINSAVTFNLGVDDSVAIGTTGGTAKSNNTAYVNRVGMITSGDAYEGLLGRSVLTADRTWTLPNNSGTIALTSDYTLAAVLGTGADTSTNDINVTNGDSINLIDGGGNNGYVQGGTYTADRTWTFPDADGTVMLSTSASDLTMSEGNDIATGTVTGSIIAKTNLQKLGFYGATPIVQPATITQTYSTTSSTHAARTAATLTDNSGGTADTTIAAITNAANAGSADVGPTANAIADLAAQVNNLKTDGDNTAQVVNDLIDKLQTLGIIA